MTGQAACRIRRAGRVLLALVALFGLLMMPLQPGSMASGASVRHAGHGSPCHEASMIAPDLVNEGAHGASHSRPAAAAKAPATHHGPAGGQGVLASHCTACCLPLSAGVLALPVRAAVAAFEWPQDISIIGRELEPAAPPPRRVS
jgi:hypothetical protein